MQWKLFADLAEVAGSDVVEIDGEPGADGELATVDDALDALLADRPALADRVRDDDDDGSVYAHVNVLRNGTDVTATEAGLATELDDGDELALFPPVSGG
ncbi:MoaD/ThiS family protein [Salinarchaeum chitinilyticum]